MMEDKQRICDAMCETLRLTRAAGSPTNNPLVELKYMTKEEGGRFEETVRPIFEDGCGKNGYYDINISWDSGIAIVMDIVNQFVKKMW
jgi:hypothetical protein